MIRFLTMVTAGCFALSAAALPAPASELFPYPVKIEQLDNGLRVVSIPLTNPDIIAFYTIVRSGSRNEIEPGKSGFAHFFEHIMFKGTKTVPRPAYDDYLTRLGAGTNGYTSDDYTCYYVVFAGRNNLEEVVRTEADRFLNLYYTEDMVKTEAPVIEGEYLASVSNPGRRLDELLRDTAYDAHSYKHTTLGYLHDIQDMPHQYEYSLLYKERFYAPDNCLLLVVGDFDHARLMELIRTHYGPWKRSNYVLLTPVEPPQMAARRAHLAWPGKTVARLSIGFHGPAFSDEVPDKAALDLLAAVAFAPSSPIVQRLVRVEQKCLSLSADFSDNRDPGLLVLNAAVKNDDDLAYVETQILQELQRLKSEPVSEKELADIKSNLKYSAADALGTTDGVAGTLAFYLNLTGDPGTINRLFALYERVTPADIRSVAARYFRTENSTTVTLAAGGAK
ncbi:MAG: M16 family metallopeptidase [Candidatus Aminicenantales bacterium]